VIARAAGFILVAVCLVATALWQVQLRTDIRDFFFPGDAADAEFLVGQLQSDALSRRYLLSIDHPGMDSSQAAPFIDALRQRLGALEEVSALRMNRFSEADLKQLLRFYQPHAVHLYSLEPQEDFDRLVSPPGLEAQARQVREALLGPDPMLVKSLLAKDPMLLTLNLFQQLGDRFATTGDSREHTSFTLDTVSEGLDLDAQVRFQQQLEATFAGLNAEFGNRFDMQYTGVPVFAASIRAQAKRDVRKIGSLSAVAVMVLSLWVFRSWRALLCIGALLVFTVSVAALVTQWLFGYLHGLTLALGMTLVGVCIDYFIHSLVHAGDKSGDERAAAVRRIWPTLLIGAATTLVGYVALSISGFPGLRQIAIFTGAGIMTALLAARFVLPDLMNLLRLRIQPKLALQGLLRVAAMPALRYVVLAAVVAIGVIGGSRMHWGNDLDMQTPALNRLIETDKRIRSRLASVEPGRFVLVEGVTVEQALRAAERLQPVLAELRAQGKLADFYPLFPWLASQQLQADNERAWNARLTPALRTAWAGALDDKGLVADAFPALAAAHPPYLQPDDLDASPAWPFVSRQLTVNPGRTFVAVWLGRHDPQALRSALQATPGARYFSQKDSIDRLAAEYRENARTMLLLGIAAILAMLTLRYRSPVTAVSVLVPAALSIVLLLGSWGLSGRPLGMLHLIGLLLTAAVCVDYAIFFLENTGRNALRTFQAITLSAVTTSVSFACLGIADNPALHALAWTVSPGVLAGFLLCPVMLRERARRWQGVHGG
jgi:predicted exporter